MERICGLEAALRQRETSLQKLNAQLHSKDAHQGQPPASLVVPRGEFGATSMGSQILSGSMEQHILNITTD